MTLMATDCGFTLDHYRDILEALKKRRLMLFRDVDTSSVKIDPIVIIRHDVDFSVEAAFEMAQLEHQLGVYSTYFIRIDARYYNPFELTNLQKLQQILKLGHDIGLHYSTAHAELQDVSLHESVGRQLRALRELLGHNIIAGAPHEHSRSGVDIKDLLGHTPLTVDAYEPRFVKEMKYISDSSGRWRDGCACEWLDVTSDLCILVHPFWWYKQTPLERF
jgi:hypothetical protein